MTQPTQPKTLVRGLGLVQATSLNMIYMVGIGPFVVIPFVIQSMGGPQCLLAWLAGALLALFDGCIWAEVAATCFCGRATAGRGGAG
jgi:fructoselysine transporter